MSFDGGPAQISWCTITHLCETLKSLNTLRSPVLKIGVRSYSNDQQIQVLMKLIKIKVYLNEKGAERKITEHVPYLRGQPITLGHVDMIIQKWKLKYKIQCKQAHEFMTSFVFIVS